MARIRLCGKYVFTYQESIRLQKGSMLSCTRWLLVESTIRDSKHFRSGCQCASAKWLRNALLFWESRKNSSVKKKETAKTNALREAIRLHWETAMKLHFGARSVSPYPAYTALVCPSPPLAFWNSLMSWAVCDRCGRKDATLWKTPQLTDGRWKSVYSRWLNKYTMG